MIFLELFWTFFKIGLFTFGGGYAMIPLIQDAVLEKGWLLEEQIINFIAVSESTPGPFAINMATYVGAEVAGTMGVFAGIFGAACATLGVVLPSFVIILLVARCFEKFRDHKVVKGCMSGLKPAVVGLIAAALLSIGQTVLFPNGLSWTVFSEAPIYISLAIFEIYYTTHI
jgi:chromate transporter